MGIPNDEIVVIQSGQRPGDPTVISINCCDQLGLGCDLARVLLEFGLYVVKGDFTTDGKWCLIIFWVTPRDESQQAIRWNILKKRLIMTCPSTRTQLLLPLLSQPKAKEEVYILQTCSLDRMGLLHDVVRILWELELTIHKMKGTVRPDDKVVNLLYLTDIRQTLHEKKRQESICDRVKAMLGDRSSLCELSLAGTEWKGLEFLPESSLPPFVVETFFHEASTGSESRSHKLGANGALSQQTSATLDNFLSPGLTLLQISCKDRKGLMYDCTRVLKDFQIQVAYGRLSTKPTGMGDLDLFILQGDGKKIMDPEKQNVLCRRLEAEILEPVRIEIVSRGPETELLVASPTEINGRGRPRVLYDITLTLKQLNISIFKADLGKYIVDDRRWELYRLLLVETPAMVLSAIKSREHITDQVKKVLVQ